jgi:hypothetical protein
MVDSGELDAAVLAVLQADATLESLLPDGVYMDEAPPGVTQFVLVGLMDSEDVSTYGTDPVLEYALYFVKGTALSSTNANMKAVRLRLDELLHGATLTAPGYIEVKAFRERNQPRLRYIDVDRKDPTLRWWHRGGHYRIEATRPASQP